MILIKKNGVTKGQYFFEEALKVDELEVISVTFSFTLVVFFNTFVQYVEKSF